MLRGAAGVEAALRRVGELLEARGFTCQIVIIGGAAINLAGLVSRATTDVDIVAFATGEGTSLELIPPDDPLPPELLRAAATVAADLGLAADWLNAAPGPQWRTGLPPGMTGRVHWLDYGGLRVGVADRYDLIFFKLYAAVDATGPESVHVQDLVALRPTDEELTAAAEWVRSQDPSPAIAQALPQVIDHVRSRRA